MGWEKESFLQVRNGDTGKVIAPKSVASVPLHGPGLVVHPETGWTGKGRGCWEQKTPKPFTLQGIQVLPWLPVDFLAGQADLSQEKALLPPTFAREPPPPGSAGSPGRNCSIPPSLLPLAPLVWGFYNNSIVTTLKKPIKRRWQKNSGLAGNCTQ